MTSTFRVVSPSVLTYSESTKDKSLFSRGEKWRKPDKEELT